MKGKTLYFVLAYSLIATLILSASTPLLAQTQGEVEGIKHRVEALEAKVSQMQEQLLNITDPTMPLNINVNCNAGEAVSDALAMGQSTIRPLFIHIEGVCEESVFIGRDNVNLGGMSREDGIQAPNYGGFAVTIYGASMVRLGNLTISGGGIASLGGASYEANGITVEGAYIALSADKGAYGILRNVTIQNSSWGVYATSAAHLIVIDSQINGNDWGVNASGGGTLKVEGSTIEDNQRGARVTDGGVLSIQNSVIQNSTGIGLLIENNGTVVAANGTSIKHNNQGGLGQSGVKLNFAGALRLFESTVEDNIGHGIVADVGSVVEFWSGSVVRNNSGSGVFLADASMVGGGGQIMDNDEWGVFCADTSSRIAGYGSPELEIGSNGEGITNCQ